MGKPSEDPVENHVSGQSNKPISAPAHALGYEQVAQELGGDIQDGLSQEAAKARLEEHGRNEFGEQAGVQPVRIFIAQIANALTLVSTPKTRCEPLDLVGSSPIDFNWSWISAKESNRFNLEAEFTYNAVF